MTRNQSDARFSAAELDSFQRDGYVIARSLAPADLTLDLQQVVRRHLDQRIEPAEYEADLHYPGAPASRQAAGGKTIRRLLQAYARDALFRNFALSAPVAGRLRQLLGAEVMLSQAHHNCVMTKEPRFSSRTGWHQDIRYWSFERPELISVWLALGEEYAENGGLLLLPGTHALSLERERFDQASFLREDFSRNQELFASQVSVDLRPGDALFFHCRLFHAASANRTGATKLSLVFTYHAADNHPLPNSRSAALFSIVI